MSAEFLGGRLKILERVALVRFFVTRQDLAHAGVIQPQRLAGLLDARVLPDQNATTIHGNRLERVCRHSVQSRADGVLKVARVGGHLKVGKVVVGLAPVNMIYHHTVRDADERIYDKSVNRKVFRFTVNSQTDSQITTICLFGFQQVCIFSTDLSAVPHREETFYPAVITHFKATLVTFHRSPFLVL